MPLKPDFSVLADPQRRLWPLLNVLSDQFVLYGGTAIALRLGHRNSVDFDFFSEFEFDPLVMRSKLQSLDDAKTLQSAPNTLTLIVDCQGEVKLSCFGLISGRVGQPDETDDGVLLVASPLDLMAHKLKPVLQRAEGRDYQDIAALVRSGIPLGDGLGAAAQIFTPDFPTAACAKALTYFEDLGESWRLNRDDRDLLTKSVAQLPVTIPAMSLAARSLR